MKRKFLVSLLVHITNYLYCKILGYKSNYYRCLTKYINLRVIITYLLPIFISYTCLYLEEFVTTAAFNECKIYL